LGSSRLQLISHQPQKIIAHLKTGQKQSPKSNLIWMIFDASYVNLNSFFKQTSCQSPEIESVEKLRA